MTKAVIMAAGKGTRMLPLTENLPKVLIEVAEKPFLHYVIHNLKEAGIEEIGIIAGYKKDKIAEFLKDKNIPATIIDQDDPKGTGDAIMRAEKFADGEPIIVLGGDNLWSVKDIQAVNNDDQLSYISAKKSDTPEKYGVLVTDEKGFLKKIVEKPKEFVGNLINTGLYKFTPEIFAALKGITLSTRGEYELTDAITILAEQGKVKVVPIQDYWLDLGCKEDIPFVEQKVKEIFNT